MTGKEYLWQYREANAELKRIESEISSIDDLLGSVTVDPTSEKVQSSHDPDQIGKLIARKSDMLDELNRKKAETLELLKEISDVIAELSDPDEKLLVQLRYVKMLSWKNVEREMRKAGRYYSEEWMMKHHKRAMGEIEELTNCTAIYRSDSDIV